MNKANIGQHYLVDKTIILKMASFAKRGDMVLDIGAGDGRISRAIINNGARVRAIEIDEGALTSLKKSVPEAEIIIGDALAVDYGKFNKIIANIPFHITEPLLERLIHEDFKEAVLLTGDNFYYSIVATPEDKLFSKTTILVNSFYKTELIQKVSKTSFDPVPRTNSTIVRLTPTENVGSGYVVFRYLLLHRNKKIKNSLLDYLTMSGNRTKNEARAVIEGLDMNEDILNLYLENINNEQLREAFIKTSILS